MKVDKLFEIISSDFYTGVPDSQLQPLCNFLMSKFGIDPKHHIIAANEGNAVALAAGYHLATGEVPVVYLQNSGEGNILNPVASLMNDKVYGIPCVFIIGWRGEPGVHDEPQHIYQGEITLKLLEIMDICSYVIDKGTTDMDITAKMAEFKEILASGKQVAFVVRKGALEYDCKIKYENSNTMLREEVIRHIVKESEKDIIISTTGKTSRELFEIREANEQSHGYDFLTVGSMGHTSSIALGIAAQKQDKKIWIIDGDGAALMHMGSMAVMGAFAPKNIVHIIINNSSHESVGGMPTISSEIDLVKIAEGCGYHKALSVRTLDELDSALKEAKNINELILIEAKCAIGSRENLGRPSTTAKENKESFMKIIAE